MPIKDGYAGDADDVNTVDALGVVLFLRNQYSLSLTGYTLNDSDATNNVDSGNTTADYETSNKVGSGFTYFDRIDDGSLDTNKWDTSTSGYASVTEAGSGLLSGYIEMWTGQNNGAGTATVTSKTSGLFSTSNRIDTYIGHYRDSGVPVTKIQLTDGTNTVDLYNMTGASSTWETHYYHIVYDSETDTVDVYRDWDFSAPVASEVDVSSVTGTKELKYYCYSSNAADGYVKVYFLSLEKKTDSILQTTNLASESVNGFCLTSVESDTDSNHTISWSYSTDGGVNWTSFDTDKMVWFTSSSSDVRLKATFTCPSDDTARGPRLTEYAIAWLR